MALSCTVFEMFDFEKYSQSEALKVIKTGTIQQPAYGFLLAYYSNFVSKMHRFWDIRLWKVSWPWNHRGLLKVTGNNTIW